MRSFVIRTNKTSGTANLYTTIRRRTPSPLTIKINSLIEVSVTEWIKAHPSKSSEDTSSKYYRLYRNSLEGSRVEEQMQKVDEIITDVLEMDEARDDKGYNEEFIKKQIASDIDSIILQPIRVERAEQNKVIMDEMEKTRKDDVMRFAYCYLAELAGADVEDNARGDEWCKAVFLDSKSHDDYLDRLCNGDARLKMIHEKNGRVAKTTHNQWYYFIHFFKRFYDGNKFGWNGLDSTIIKKYVRFCNSLDLIHSTKATRIEYFRIMSNAARKEKVHNQDVSFAFEDWAKGSDTTEKKTQIYLTIEELDALYNTPLSGNEELVRDVFLVGCYTCQRISDYIRISKDMMAAKGALTYISLKQQKTKTEVAIPLHIFGDNLENILKKYDYTLPAMGKNGRCNIDRVIKRIAERLSEDCPSLAEKIPTVMTSYEKRDDEAEFEKDSQGRLLVPKYKLISSHTARRSGITNMFKTHKFNDRQMRAVSGHKSQKVFEEYIKMSGAEFAEEIERLAQMDINNPISNF